MKISKNNIYYALRFSVATSFLMFIYYEILDRNVDYSGLLIFGSITFLGMLGWSAYQASRVNSKKK